MKKLFLMAVTVCLLASSQANSKPKDEHHLLDNFVIVDGRDITNIPDKPTDKEDVACDGEELDNASDFCMGDLVYFLYTPFEGPRLTTAMPWVKIAQMPRTLRDALCNEVNLADIREQISP